MPARILVLTLFALLSRGVLAQIVDPEVYRGTVEALVHGTLDTTLVELRMSNHGELVSPSSSENAVWPRGVGGGYLDGLALLIASKVVGEREKWAARIPEWEGRPDTVLTPISIHYGEVGVRRGPENQPWGWLPVPGFFNAHRLDSLGLSAPLVAASVDPSTWPEFWPDRVGEHDSGWPGRWNGLLGPNSLVEGSETYYVMDDLSNAQYLIDPQTTLPNSPHGVFYPDPADSTKGGLGLQVGVRSLAFLDLLFEDMVFFHIYVANVGGVSHDSLYVALYADTGLGERDPGDEIVLFDADERIVVAWDHDGLGVRSDGSLYEVGYVGMTFLGDSPGLTGYDVDMRPYYEAADHLQDDAWLWDRIVVAESRIEDGVAQPSGPWSDFEPAVLLTSGPHALAPSEDVSLVAALIFGRDEADFYRNLYFARKLHEASFSTATVVTVSPVADRPEGSALRANYPNPFSATTTISYALARDNDVTLTVYDVLGREVREVASGTKPSGTHEVSFDATDLPSGVYFYRLQAGGDVEAKWMMVVK